MKQLVLGLVVGLVWIILTAAVAWAVPPRGGDTQPDLSVDPHWQLRTPYNPMQYDKVRPGTRATTTTTRPTTPPPNASPRPRNLQSPRQMQAPVQFAAGVEQWRSLVAQYPGWNVDVMLRIIRCESGGRPDARNSSSGAAGLLQIYPARAGSFDPATNIAQGYAKWVANGYQPWVSSRGCWG